MRKGTTYKPTGKRKIADVPNWWAWKRRVVWHLAGSRLTLHQGVANSQAG
jgi:hypothetical protein